MKNKLKLYSSNFNYYTKSQSFKFIFIFMIIFSFFTTSTMPYVNGRYLQYIPGLLSILNNRIFIVIILVLLFANTLNTYTYFNSSDFYIIRLSSKKKYLKELINSTIFNNILILLLQLFMLLIGLNIFCGHDLGLTNIENYKIINIVYVLIFIFKNTVILILISIINVVLLNVVNKNILTIINILYYISFIFGTILYDSNNINNRLKVNLIDYLTSQKYSSFVYALTINTVYIFILLLLIFILFQCTYKNIKQVSKW